MKIYELNWKYDHLIDQNEDCSVITFDGIEEFRFQMGGIQRYDVSRIILLQGNFNIIPSKSDFPVVDIGVPLMSKKMLLILEEDEILNINKVDASIIDDTYIEPLFDKNGSLGNNVPYNNEYQFIQILNFSTVFDRDNSIFKPLRSNPEKIGVINKLVLKEPSEGFPPIFRIEEKPSVLFINEVVKRKFENNNIQGCVFKEIDTVC